MADLTITAANVKKGTGAVLETGIAGVAVTAGQPVYKDASNSNKFGLSDCNSATSAQRSVYGIAMHAAGADQPLVVQKGGQITIGATVVPGTVYCVSGTPGGIRPVADNTSGDFVSLIGVAVSTTVIDMGCMFNSGVSV